MPGRLLRAAGSLRLALAGMLVLGIVTLASYRLELSPVWTALALTLLACNLIAALIDRPQFRRQSGLLVFHLCLLAIILLAAASSMTRFAGRVEIVEGQAFDPASVVTVRAGPWHPRSRLERVAFEQGEIRVGYAPNLVRGDTRSELVLSGEGHGGRSSVMTWVGDTRSVPFSGYRFITTSNKGYAALLSWKAPGAPALGGAVHMPAYPLFEWKQRNRWTAPGGDELELELELPPLTQDRSWTFGSDGVAGRLTIRDAGLGKGSGSITAGTAVTLRPGESITLEKGVLRFDGLRAWMGYRIEFDPLLPWLFAAAMLGVVGLARHFHTRLWAASSLPGGSRSATGERLGHVGNT